MRISVIVFLFPLVFFSQSNRYFPQPDQYFTLQAEIDARNALVGGTVNEVGYDVVLKAGFSAQWFRADIFFEKFKILKYSSAGVNLTHLFSYRRAFKQGLGLQISVIDKPKKLTPSFGGNALLEYHFGQFFVSARAETKMRTDWDITVNSGFLGVGFKI